MGDGRARVPRTPRFSPRPRRRGDRDIVGIVLLLDPPSRVGVLLPHRPRIRPRRRRGRWIRRGEGGERDGTRRHYRVRGVRRATIVARHRRGCQRRRRTWKEETTTTTMATATTTTLVRGGGGRRGRDRDFAWGSVGKRAKSRTTNETTTATISSTYIIYGGERGEGIGRRR
jgi:hypothetical protein